MAVMARPSSIFSTVKVGVPSSVIPVYTTSIPSTAQIFAPEFVSSEATGYLPTNIQITLGFEGPQLIIKWSPPNSTLISQYRIVRREWDFPQHPTDGIVVFDTEDPRTPFLSNTYVDLPTYMFTDSEINSGKGVVESRVYFYQFFCKKSADALWITDESVRVRGFGIKTGYFAHKLYQSLPDLYRLRDKEI